jgi:hypothetical protein
MLATLEERLTGASADQALEDNADAQVGEHRQVTVFRLRTTLVEALATEDDDELRDIAGPWSKTDEFFGAADPEELGQGLVRLAALARDARTDGAPRARGPRWPGQRRLWNHCGAARHPNEETP